MAAWSWPPCRCALCPFPPAAPPPDGATVTTATAVIGPTPSIVLQAPRKADDAGGGLSLDRCADGYADHRARGPARLLEVWLSRRVFPSA